jgi:phage terminase large subunit GpA-like protein
MSRPLVEDEKKRRQRLRVKRKRGIPVEPIGVDGGKALLYARLKLTAAGPGYIHFPQDPAFDDEYFAQLAAEKLVTKYKGYRPIAEWVQMRPRNEALDCLLLALVALRLTGKDLKHWQPDVKVGAGETATTEQSSAVLQTTHITPPRRRPADPGFGTSDWNL